MGIVINICILFTCFNWCVFTDSVANGIIKWKVYTVHHHLSNSGLVYFNLNSRKSLIGVITFNHAGCWQYRLFSHAK